jgi:hypothetical protein
MNMVRNKKKFFFLFFSSLFFLHIYIYIYIYPEIEDTYRKQVAINWKKREKSICCLIDFLDSSESEHYSAMREQYMAKANGFLLIYDITNRNSFEYLAERIVPNVRAANAAVQRFRPMVLVGNKLDLEAQRQVSVAEGQAFARQINAQVFLESSVKDHVNVEEPFYELSRMHIRELKGGAIARKAALCLICLRKFAQPKYLDRLPLDIIIMIARALYATRMDPCWLESTYRKPVAHKPRCSLQ